MSDGLVCDRCGRPLLVHEDVRYEVTLRIQSAYDVMELDLDAIAQRDVGDELSRLQSSIEAKTAEELEAEVWKEFKFDVCGRCQREMLKDPLPRRAGPD